MVFVFAWSWRTQPTVRKWLLLLASYVFYGWWDWRFCFLLLGASLIAWLAGVWLGKVDGPRERKSVVAFAVVALLGVLGFFKYYGFFLSSLQDLLFAIGWQRDLPILQIILPVGISFFTFQAISYVVDVYRGQIDARRQPLDVLLYISFFPQLVAGPIVRAADFLPQLERLAVLDRRSAIFGLALCSSGLLKKMVIANYLAQDLVDPVFLDPGSYSSLVNLLAVYGYAVQIYCDFSGYSDIAIGTAALLGFQFKANFNQPYRATSLQDFWRRWHMSLSQWLRDYLYIPLGGSRFGRWKTYRNLFLTMFLGGLWHGAAWNFIIWGTIHGLWLCFERAAGLARSVTRFGAVFSWLVVFHIVCAAWIFFRASDLGTALDMFGMLGAFTADLGELTWFTLGLIVSPLAAQFAPPAIGRQVIDQLTKAPFWLSAFLFVGSLLIIIWVSPSGTAPFIYFQF